MKQKLIDFIEDWLIPPVLVISLIGIPVGLFIWIFWGMYDLLSRLIDKI